MADRTQQILPGGQSSAPYTYTIPSSTEFDLLAVRATFDGTGAGGAFLPCVKLVSDAGVVMAETIGSSVAAGGTADASFFPRVRRTANPSSVTYAERIILLKSKYTCVAEWRLSEGSTPYADTSGFAPGDPATMVRQVRTIPMTQNFASGPLLSAPAGPSVAYNFDGDALTNQGDFLTDACTTPSRYQFAGNAIFTVVTWVQPGAGVNTHYGPVIQNLHTTGGTEDNGWRINVNQPGAIPQFQRASHAASLASYNTVAGSGLSTSQWSMLVGTYDGSTMRFYINGTQIGSVASAGAIGGSATNLFLGEGTHQLGDYGTWYYGAQSQTSVWAATFTPTDISNLYQSAFN